MAIFNSLGSNYNLSYLLKSLTTIGSIKDLKKLIKLLEDKYRGEATLLYKGREALSLALEIMDLPEDSEIAINGFTCVAVFNSIRSAGYEPVCLDLEDTGGLNFTPRNLEKAVDKNKKIRAVVVQNTLGYPCEIEEIQKICREHNLILIEDLAHCIGTSYKNGKKAGTVGDFTILSFSQDKIIDAVSGGALVVRNKKYQNIKNDLKFKSPKHKIKDRLYPNFTYKIRALYGFGFGKPYHFLLKNLKLLSDINDESFYNLYSITPWSASLAVFEFGLLDAQLVHRKKIANIYIEELPDSIFMFDKKKTQEAVDLSSNLRFPIFVENRDSLIRELKRNGIYLEDIWYVDVAPECPNAVGDTKRIINLPTHINVSEENARIIAGIIGKWIKSQ